MSVRYEIEQDRARFYGQDWVVVEVIEKPMSISREPLIEGMSEYRARKYAKALNKALGATK